MGGSRGHWEEVYAAKSETAVSWYQPHSVRSLELIEKAASDRGASVIDVGGGASTLVDDLIRRDFSDLTVLDIAQSALERSKARLGNDAAKVTWIAADITRWTPPRTWGVWHDRAVFHFLTERAHQDAYIAALKAATRPGATAIFATFALDGPEKCSGLPVQRYSAETLACRLGPAFALAGQASESHCTPAGLQQHFSYAVLRRR
jgi:2-polyprenyl-3-methyl-5-hydroxy-6-metoxy-1,4-benzoquinol methylase